MHLGRAIGYSLIALVDAFVPTLVAVFITGFTLVGHSVAGFAGSTIALLAGVVTFCVTLLASAVSHARGGSPFAFTRFAKVVLKHFFFWPPWAGWHR